MHHSVKASGDASVAKSDVCRSDTYFDPGKVHILRRKASFSLVIIMSSPAFVSISASEKKDYPVQIFPRRPARWVKW